MHILSDAILSPGVPNTPGDDMESLSAAEQRLFHLQRQLDIEMKAECDTELKKASQSKLIKKNYSTTFKLGFYVPQK